MHKGSAMSKRFGGQGECRDMKSRLALERFAGGYHCAPSVFLAFCDELSIGKDLALKAACGLGAGMDRKEEVCGAATGGIMVIGAMYGKGETGGHSALEDNLFTVLGAIVGSIVREKG